MNLTRTLAAALATAVGLGLIGLGGAEAQQSGATEVGKPVTLGRGRIDTVSRIMARELVNPYIPGTKRSKYSEKEGPDRRGLKNDPRAQRALSWPPAPPFGPESTGSFSLGVGFEGSRGGIVPWNPPDTHGAVGPTQIIIQVNGRVRLFSKAGVLGALDATADNFFASVRGNQSAVDPRAKFDRLSNRWILSAMTFGNPNRLLLAVSDGPTITNETSFRFFGFTQDQVGGGTVDNGLADYPTLGVDRHAVYIGCNMFTPGFGVTLFVIRKSDLLTNVLTVTAFRGLADAPWNILTPNGADNDDPAGTVGYVVGTARNSLGSLRLIRVNNPGGTPSLTVAAVGGVLATTVAGDVPQSGSSALLDSVDDRLFNARIALDRTSGQRTLWTAHHVGANAVSGSSIHPVSRWYQIANLDGTPSCAQVGTVFTATDANVNWFPTIATSGQGHSVMGFSVGGRPIFAGAGYAARLRTDALGTFGSAQSFVNGLSAFTGGRWGDYSHTVVDPTDDQTFWTFQEFAKAGGEYGVWVQQIRAPGVPASLTCTPNRVFQGQTNVDLTVSGSPSNGQEIYDTDASFSRRLAAAFSGTGITVNSVTRNGPNSATVNVTVASTAALGARNLTVTNPDGQIGTGTGALTVDPNPVSVAPADVNLFRGVLIDGGLSAFSAIDGSVYEVQRGPVLTSLEPPIQVILGGTAPPSVTGLTVRVHSRANTPGLVQRVDAFDYVANAYVSLGENSLTTTLTTYNYTATNPSRFVRPSDGRIQMRVTARQSGVVLTTGFRFRVDQAVWIVNR